MLLHSSARREPARAEMIPPRRNASARALVAACCALALARGGAAGAEGIRFAEVSRPWGLDFRHHTAGSGQFFMVETLGSGVVAFDYDADGDPDLLFVDSGPLPGYEGEPPRSRLFRNDGARRFVDVTERAGIRVRDYGMGGTAGDVDGDGDLDLYVTAFGDGQLFRNEGDGTFADVTARAGVANGTWGTSAAFADADRDGDLDLYVTNYLDFSIAGNVVCRSPALDLRSHCAPSAYQGLHDRYYRNRGDGTFEDATAAAGFGEANGKGLGVVWSDLDDDGWQDLYVANDTTPNLLFRNRGNGTFEEIGLASGVALSDRGKAEGGMGVEAADLDGDGRRDLLVTNFDLESNGLYGNLGSWLFVDRRYASRLAEPSLLMVGFGVVAADLDHDSDLDLVVANGHIIQNIEQWEPAKSYRQRNQVFENDGGGRFTELRDVGVDVVRSSRGLAAADLDGDGDLDLAVSNADEGCEVYENRLETGRPWLQVALASGAANRHAIGARLELDASGRRQRREIRTSSSYLSQNELAAHFGLAGAAEARLAVHWPDGAVTSFAGVPARRQLTILR